MTSIKEMKQSFAKSFDDVNARVDDLTTQSRSRSRTPSPRPKDSTAGTERSSRSGITEPNTVTRRRSKGAEPYPSRPWYSRRDTVDDLPPITDDDFDEDDHNIEPEDSYASKLSEEINQTLNTAITSTLSNSERREIRAKYPVPETDLTRTPKLDEIFTSTESRFQKNTEAKGVDKDLLHVTACTLDVARPLLDLIEGVNSGSLTLENIKDRAFDALTLLGNSVAQTSAIRRRRVMKVCNPDIVSLADNKELFANAPPMLFGEGFEVKMKDRAEALKVLHKGQSTSYGQKRSFFRGNRPSTNPQRGGGYGYQGSGNSGYQQNRYAPYRTFNKTTRTFQEKKN